MPRDSNGRFVPSSVGRAFGRPDNWPSRKTDFTQRPCFFVPLFFFHPSSLRDGTVTRQKAGSILGCAQREQESFAFLFFFFLLCIKLAMEGVVEIDVLPSELLCMILCGSSPLTDRPYLPVSLRSILVAVCQRWRLVVLDQAQHDKRRINGTVVDPAHKEALFTGRLVCASAVSLLLRHRTPAHSKSNRRRLFASMLSRYPQVKTGHKAAILVASNTTEGVRAALVYARQESRAPDPPMSSSCVARHGGQGHGWGHLWIFERGGKCALFTCHKNHGSGDHAGRVCLLLRVAVRQNAALAVDLVARRCDRQCRYSALINTTICDTVDSFRALLACCRRRLPTSVCLHLWRNVATYGAMGIAAELSRMERQGGPCEWERARRESSWVSLAAKNGALEIVEFCHRHALDYDVQTCFTAALRGSHIALCAALVERHPDLPQRLALDDADPLVGRLSSCTDADLPVASVEWLLDQQWFQSSEAQISAMFSVFCLPFGAHYLRNIALSNVLGLIERWPAQSAVLFAERRAVRSVLHSCATKGDVGGARAFCLALEDLRSTSAAAAAVRIERVDLWQHAVTRLEHSCAKMHARRRRDMFAGDAYSLTGNTMRGLKHRMLIRWLHCLATLPVPFISPITDRDETTLPAGDAYSRHWGDLCRPRPFSRRILDGVKYKGEDAERIDQLARMGLLLDEHVDDDDDDKTLFSDEARALVPALHLAAVLFARLLTTTADGSSRDA